MVAAFGDSPVFVLIGLGVLVAVVLVVGLVMAVLGRLTGWLMERMGPRGD